MAESTARKILVAAAAWVVILAALAAAYRYLVHPSLAGKLESETGTGTRYASEVALAADSFSGYCVLRSEAMKGDLRSKGVKFSIQDDKADYAARTRALRDGRIQMAAFTVDSLVSSCAGMGEFPATIVMVIDETSGADAIVSPPGGPKSLQDLSGPEARFVLTPGSPSEFLARVVIAHFNLPGLPKNWRVDADGAAEVLAKMNSSARGASSQASAHARTAYVLWEPYVSKAVASGARVLFDSSKVKGYVVDVLVAERRFLREKPEVVRAVVESYFRALHAAAREPDGMARLVMDDAASTGSERLDESQAKRLAAGILWRNTLENYAHFGLLSNPEPGGPRHMEDVVTNTISVLLKTGALDRDPLPGKAGSVFYDRVLREMRDAQFHPGTGLAALGGAGAEPERVRSDAELTKLSDDEWRKLVPVGELKVAPIAFARGGFEMGVQGKRDLAELAGVLRSFPRYYLAVVGHARADGDPDENMALARARAKAAADFLGAQGVSPDRISARADPPAASDGSAQSVSFVLGQAPY